MIDGAAYKKNSREAHGTITSSGMILESMKVPLKESLINLAQKDSSKTHDYRPNKALQELKEIQTEQIEYILFLLKEQKIEEALREAETLKKEDSLSQILKAVEFKNLYEAQQKGFINLMKGRDFHQLTLKNASALEDKHLFTDFIFNHLISLNLKGALGLTDRVFPLLAQKAIGLRTLNLSLIPGIKKIADSGVFLDGPLMFPSLEVLNVSSCNQLEVLKIEAPSLKRLKAAYSKLKTVQVLAPLLEGGDLRGNKKLTDDEFNLTSTALSTLQLQGCPQISYVKLREKYPCIPFILLKNERVREDEKALQALNDRRTQSLYLGDKGLHKEEAQALAQTLTNLTSLDLWGNKIGEGGAQAIAKTLTNLTSLDLWNNKIGEGGARALAQTLTNLTSLYLAGNEIGEEGACAIAKTLTNLTSLNLYNNSIREEGACALAQSLTNLTKLSLARNLIRDEGACAIAQTLTNLTSLNLAENKIGDGGKAALEQLKRKNPKFYY
jgi:hypothetical protein